MIMYSMVSFGPLTKDFLLATKRPAVHKLNHALHRSHQVARLLRAGCFR